MEALASQIEGGQNMENGPEFNNRKSLELDARMEARQALHHLERKYGRELALLALKRVAESRARPGQSPQKIDLRSSCSTSSTLRNPW